MQIIDSANACSSRALWTACQSMSLLKKAQTWRPSASQPVIFQAKDVNWSIE